jgi:hypothetical protein
MLVRMTVLVDAPRPVIVSVTARSVRPAFRLEGRHLLDHSPSQPLHHASKDGVGCDAKPPRSHLHRHMAIAQVIGNAGQLRRIITGHGHHRLGGCIHPDYPTGVVAQTVSAAHEFAAGQAEHHWLAVVEDQTLTRALASLDIETDRCLRRCPGRNTLSNETHQNRKYR